jgi:hypothetical protein
MTSQGKEVRCMEVKVKLQKITVKDEETGEVFTVKTLRTAKEIADYVAESEKEEIVDRLEEAVLEAY